MAFKILTEMTSKLRSRSIVFSLVLLSTSTAALAHGEEALITLGLLVLAFFGSFLAIRLSSYLQRHRFAAKAGVVFGLATVFWPVGSLPHNKYETLVDTYAFFACPVFMLVFYYIAKLINK